MNTWTSNIPAYIDALRAALPEGITDAGVHYQTELQAELHQGFTTGKFVTGELADSITIVPVADDDDFTVTIGTDNPVAVYWELGFHHAGTGQFERVQIWEPVFTREVDQMVAIIVDRLEGLAP
jgi:hypothetical protein